MSAELRSSHLRERRLEVGQRLEQVLVDDVRGRGPDEPRE
jgi:hypothetical protein